MKARQDFKIKAETVAEMQRLKAKTLIYHHLLGFVEQN